MPSQEHAVIVTAPRKAELLPLEIDPSPLKPTEVAGHTLATLISAGTELAYNYEGQKYPSRPGYAAVFRVESAGAEVTDLKPGDVAFCMGNHQSYQRRMREDVVPVPAGLRPEVAVFARMMGVSMSTLTTTIARPPEMVVVSGLGPIGNMAAQVFTACGYQVIACDPLAERRRVAAEVGLADVRAAIPLDDALVAGRAGLVVECSGHEQAAMDGCKVVRQRGEVVLVGVPWKKNVDLQVHDMLHVIFHHYVVLRSGWEWEVPGHATPFMTNSLYGNFAAALKWLAQGRVKAQGLYQTVSPGDAQEVYQNLLNRRAQKLAMVFDWAR